MESPETTAKPVAEQTSVKAEGRYEIQEELGRGATGVVYKAYDRVIGRTVALKAISVERNTPNREELIERLKLEAKAAGKLDHPNIITIYDVGQEDDVIYLSMQFIDGKTLLTYLAEDGVPPLPTFISWADQVLTAVGFAHAHGVIHRDLKPANLMLTSQGTIKVLDFGVAKIGNDTMTQAGLVIGTPSYMAPEQVAGKKIDHRVDIFALGSVFYELITHEKPFRGDVTTILYKIMNEDPVPPSLINPAVPGSIDAIIRQALAKEPKERFQKCEAIRTALLEQAAVLNIKLAAARAPEKKVAARVPGSDPFPHYLLEELRPKPSRTRRILFVAITLVLIGGIASAFYARSHRALIPALGKKITALAERLWAKQAANSGKADEPTVPNSGAGQLGQATSNESSSGPSHAAGVTANLGAQPVGDNSSVNLGTASADSAKGTVTGLQTSSATEISPAAETDQPKEGGDRAESSTVSNSQAPEEQTAEGSVTSANGEQPKPTKVESSSNAQGFTREDIPNLVREADAAEELGNYRQARQKYELILKLDRNNSEARAGLYRINATEPH